MTVYGSQIASEHEIEIVKTCCGRVHDRPGMVVFFVGEVQITPDAETLVANGYARRRSGV